MRPPRNFRGPRERVSAGPGGEVVVGDPDGGGGARPEVQRGLRRKGRQPPPLTEPRGGGDSSCRPSHPSGGPQIYIFWMEYVCGMDRIIRPNGIRFRRPPGSRGDLAHDAGHDGVDARHAVGDVGQGVQIVVGRFPEESPGDGGCGPRGVLRSQWRQGLWCPHKFMPPGEMEVVARGSSPPHGHGGTSGGANMGHGTHIGPGRVCGGWIKVRLDKINPPSARGWDALASEGNGPVVVHHRPQVHRRLLPGPRPAGSRDVREDWEASRQVKQTSNLALPHVLEEIF